MFNLLGATENGIGSYIALGLMLAVFIVYIVFAIRSRKKNQEKAIQMLNELKVGDKVVTNAGIYGEIVAIRETNMGKVVTLKTGDEESKRTSFVSVNASVILGIDEKQDVVLDEQGNPIEDKAKLKEEVLKEKATAETKKEEKPAEPKQEEKPAEVKTEKEEKVEPKATETKSAETKEPSKKTTKSSSKPATKTTSKSTTKK